MNKLFDSHINFRQFLILFTAFIIVEISFRFLFHPTTLSLLFPVFVVCSYSKLNRKNLKFGNCWFYLLPFLIATPVYIYLIITSGYGLKLFNIFSIIHVITTYSLIIPPFVKGIRTFYFGLEKKKADLLTFISLLFMFNATIIMTLEFVVFSHLGSKDLFPLIKSINTFLSLLLIVMVILLLHFLHETRSLQEMKMCDDEKMKEIKTIIEHLFNDEKVFLDSDISLQKLYLMTKNPLFDLKFFFDNYLMTDFKIFVAKYRIQYAIELLENEGKNYTIETVATLCGYNSKATFNKYFKLITGTIPSDYTLNN